MKAIVHTKYGPPETLHFSDVEKPAPEDNEVLIEVRAASVNPLDLYMMSGAPWNRAIPGMRTPKQSVLGCDIAGRVEAVGTQVKELRPGDEVFGVTGFGGGGFAEYVCAVEEKVALKPVNLSFEEATAVPIAGLTALQGLRDKGRIQAGSKVLVNGASGGVGTFAVQVAKSFGAEVTAVTSTGNMEQARSLGADHVIDYTQEDFTKGAERYDLILAANAFHSIFRAMRALRRGGTYVLVGGGISYILQGVLLAPLVSRFGSKKACFFIANINRRDLDFLKELLEGGKIVPVIDRRYALSDAAEALRYLRKRHARGKVVLSVG